MFHRDVELVFNCTGMPGSKALEQSWSLDTALL